MPAAPSARHLPELDRLRSLTCAKWNWFDADVLPAWVADMDLPPAPIAVDAVRALTERGDFGYNFSAHGCLPDAYAAWETRHHGWTPDPARTRLFCDVLQAVDVALWLNTKPGDGVVIFTPVYPPFFPAITGGGRRVIDCPLRPDGWRLDAQALRDAIDQRTTAILMCNPHNPTGRAFTPDELTAVAEVAAERDLMVISDEIWADLVFAPAKHIPFASLSDDAAARTVTISAASKAFNLAGLRCAVAHIGSDELFAAFEALPRHLLGGPSSPGAAATLAAWTDGEAWLDETRGYLMAMRDRALARLAAEIPEVRVVSPEATYLMWLDFTALGLGDDPAAWLLEHARVGLSAGPDFGPHGAGFARLNFATTQGILDELIDRIVGADRSDSPRG